MSREEEPGTGESSRLCRSCGLCCEGILHEKAQLLDGEVEGMQSLGLRVRVEEGGPVFVQPCACWHENRCTIYGERPGVCRQYQCEVLRRFRAGELSLEEGLQVTRRARSLVETLRRQVPDESRESTLWQKLQIMTEGQPQDPALLLDIATLRAFCLRHFEPRPQARRSQRS